MDQAQSEDFFLDTSTYWKYGDLISHLKLSLHHVRPLINWLASFIAITNAGRKQVDQFTDALQILGRQSVSIRPKWGGRNL